MLVKCCDELSCCYIVLLYCITIINAVHIFAVLTACSAPQMKDLQNQITPHYAAHWRVIGTQLGLPKGRLDIIEHDNYHKAELCCNAVLEEWLEVDPSASWQKLFKVIESPAMCNDLASDKGG